MPAKHEIHKVFCANLKSVRLARGFTQLQVAEKLGVTKSAYAQLEQGSACPQIDTVDRVAKALGVKAIDLLSANKRVLEKTVA